VTRRGRLLVALAALWLALTFLTRPPANPEGDQAARLEVWSAVPAPVLDTLRRACFDCHSHETRWPWYATVFPASWLVTHDVREGRGQINFSRWSDYNPYDRADLLDEICAQVKDREMPLPQYRWLHPEARLGDPEIAAICAWATTEAERLVDVATE
jgi:hypothetical protein